MAMNKDQRRSRVVRSRWWAGPRSGRGCTCIQHGQSGAALKPFVWECYVVAVQHRMLPFQGYVTVATFRRGTVGAERIHRHWPGRPRVGVLRAEWNQAGATGGRR